MGPRSSARAVRISMAEATQESEDGFTGSSLLHYSDTHTSTASGSSRLTGALKWTRPPLDTASSAGASVWVPLIPYRHACTDAVPTFATAISRSASVTETVLLPTAVIVISHCDRPETLNK